MNAGAINPGEILVVDDSTENLKLLEDILSREGYRVRLAGDGELALRSARIQPPSLVLLNIGAPGMDGFEVCRLLKDDDRTRFVPIIFIGIPEDDREKVRAFEAGCVDYINEPIYPAEVLARVKTHLGLRRARLELEARHAELDAARETLEEATERSLESERVYQKLREQIDEHLRSLEAMRESEETYRTLVNNLNVGVYRNTGGPQSRFLQANPAFVRIFGYDSLEEFMEIPVSDLYQNPADRELLIDEIRLSGSVRVKELAMRKKDGSPIWTSISAIAQFDENGDIKWIDGILDDITERKRIALELRESEEKYRTLVNNLNVGIYRNTIGPHDRFLQANPAFVRIFGYDSLEEFMEIPVSDLYQNPADKELLEDEILCTGFVNVKELATRKKDGSPIWISISAIAQFDENGDIKWIDGVIDDITERKRIASELRESENKLRIILHGSPIATFVIGKDHRVIYWNNALVQLSGISADSVIGTRDQWRAFYDRERPCMADLVVDDSYETISSLYSGNFSRSGLIEEAYEATDFFPSLGEKGKWLRFTAAQIRYAGGELIGAIETLEDITDRVQAEEEISLNLAQQKTLLDLYQNMAAAPVAEIISFIVDKCVTLTGSAIGFVGLINDDDRHMEAHMFSEKAMEDCLLDKPSIFPLGEAGLWAEPVRQRRILLVNDYKKTDPLKKGLPDGHLELVRFMGVPVIEGGRVVAVACVANKREDYAESDQYKISLLLEGMWDLIKHKRVEDEIRETNERFSSVLRAATAYSIIGMDPGGIIKVFNEGAELMLGFGAADVIGKVSFESIHDPAEIAARAMEMGVNPGFEVLVSAARRGQTETREWTYIRKDGSRVTVSMTVTAMRSKDGALTGFIGIARDISGEKILEQQLLQSQKLESLGFLAGGVAHDFNNILTPILGFTEMLMNGFSEDDPRYQRLQHVKQAAERAKELTRRLLAFSRKQVFEMKSANLGQIVRQFESMLLRTIRENIRIEFRISDSAGTVRADAGQIEQVLLNLAVNAQDAMPEGGVLTVEVMDIDLEESYTAGHPEIKPGGYVMLAVSDTGEGMDKTTLEHIFEPFFTTKEMGKGTGLGLSTVYGIVKQHGGAINVYSEKNRGSTFKIFIPLEIENGAASDHTALLKDVVAHGVETILVIEDDEMVRMLVSEMLKDLGYRALLAENTDQCLMLAKEYAGPINLLLTDVIMPVMNGKDLFDLLRKIRPELNVLFMSGYTSDVIGHHGVLDEGVNFIQKPFSQHALSEKVRQALDSAGDASARPNKLFKATSQPD